MSGDTMLSLTPLQLAEYQGARDEIERLRAQLAAVTAERDLVAADLLQLAKDIESYSAEDPDNDIQTCRYADHMQGLCGCRDLAARLRAIAAARKQQGGGEQ